MKINLISIQELFIYGSLFDRFRNIIFIFTELILFFMSYHQIA